MVKRLPKVELAGKTYFVDVRLSEIRNVDQPSDNVPFSILSEEQMDAVEIAISRVPVPMEMTIRINLENDAFHESPKIELARIFGEILSSEGGQSLHQHGDFHLLDGMKLTDVNGQKVGTVEVEGD